MAVRHGRLRGRGPALILHSHAPSDGLIPPVEKSFLGHWCVRVHHAGMREQHGRHRDVSQFTAQSVLNIKNSILMSRKDKGNHSMTI